MLIPMSECVRLNKEIGNKDITGVIHAGACRGEELSSYVESGTIKKVIWVEGNKSLMKDLFDATNKLYPSSTIKQEYYNLVLSNKDGEKLNFNITNDRQCSSIFPLGSCTTHHPQISVVEQREVITTRFDTFVKEKNLNLSGYDAINVDVQGAELKVLKGFGDLLKTHPFKMIYSEINKEQIYSGGCLVNELDEYLGQFGFKRMLTFWADGGTVGWGDGVFLRRI